MPRPRRSRGPGTEAGKAVASMNAVSHGLASTSPVVEGRETEEEWRAHQEGIEASLAPEGHFEACLVERIALLLWRLGRVTAYERESMAVALSESEVEFVKAEEGRRRMMAVPFYGDAFKWAPTKEHWLRKHEANLLVPDGATLERVLRYEAHLHRQLLQTMHELEALQARRRGELAPLARLDAST